MTDAPQSSPPSCRRKVGTKPSVTPRSPTRSATASCTTRTCWRCADPPCGGRKDSAPLNPKPPPDHAPPSLRSDRRSSEPERVLKSDRIRRSDPPEYAVRREDAAPLVAASAAPPTGRTADRDAGDA